MKFYQVEIKYNENTFVLGSLSYCDNGQGLVYRPSQKLIVGEGKYTPKQGLSITTNHKGGKHSDHITIHKNGSIHVRYKKDKSMNEDEWIIPDLIPLAETGHRHLFRDFIENANNLPCELEEVPQITDKVTFKLNKPFKRVFLLVDIISSKNINSGKLNWIPEADQEAKLLDQSLIKFWENSEFTDKALVLYLFDYLGEKIEINSGRLILVSEEQPIKTP